MESKFKQIYYSNDGYWRGKSAIQELSKASGSTQEEALRKMATETAIIPNIFTTTKIYS